MTIRGSLCFTIQIFDQYRTVACAIVIVAVCTIKIFTTETGHKKARLPTLSVMYGHLDSRR